jgi:hypothetical protein
VLFNLISTDLLKHHNEYSSPSFAEILAAKELLSLVSKLDKNALALYNQGAAIQVAELNQISQVLTPMPFLIPTLLSPCYNPDPTDR